MDVEFADEMERQINTLNEQQLSALWRWVTVKYMSVCEQRLTKRAVDVAYECPKCGTTLEKGGWCPQHGLPAQPRN